MGSVRIRLFPAKIHTGDIECWINFTALPTKYMEWEAVGEGTRWRGLGAGGRYEGLCQIPTPSCLHSPDPSRCSGSWASSSQSQQVCVLAHRGQARCRGIYHHPEGSAHSVSCPGSSCHGLVISKTSAPFQNSNAPLPLPGLGTV